MKRGTTPILRVQIDMELSLIDSVDFVFKSDYCEEAPALLSKNYPKDVTYNENRQVFEIPFTTAETRLFSGRFWMDTRINTTSHSIPQTNICELYMCPTLFMED